MKKIVIAALIATTGYFAEARAEDTSASVQPSESINVETEARRRPDLFDYRCIARSNHRGGRTYEARGETRRDAQRHALNRCQRETRGWDRCYIVDCHRIFGWR